MAGFVSAVLVDDSVTALVFAAALVVAPGALVVEASGVVFVSTPGVVALATVGAGLGGSDDEGATVETTPWDRSM